MLRELIVFTSKGQKSQAVKFGEMVGPNPFRLNGMTAKNNGGRG